MQSWFVTQFIVCMNTVVHSCSWHSLSQSRDVSSGMLGTCLTLIWLSAGRRAPPVMFVSIIFTTIIMWRREKYGNIARSIRSFSFRVQIIWETFVCISTFRSANISLWKSGFPKAFYLINLDSIEVLVRAKISYLRDVHFWRSIGR